MNKLLIIIGLCLCQQLRLSATIIVPPDDLGQLLEHSDVVVYGTILDHKNADPYTNQFQIIESIKGGFLHDQIINVIEYGKAFPNRTLHIAGDVDYKLGNNYLLFLSYDQDGNLKASMLALSVLEEVTIKSKVILGHREEMMNLCFMGDINPDLTGAYLRNELISTLKKIELNRGKWNADSAGFVDGYYSGSPINISLEDSKGNCPNTAPSHCTTLIGTPSSLGSSCSISSPAKYSSNNWTVFVSSAAQNDPSNSNAINDLANAVSSMNGMPGVNVSYGGTTTCPINNPCGGAVAANSCTPGQTNNLMVFFDDPCNEISNLSGCSGILGIGGAFSSSACHTDVCGNRWHNMLDPFFVMNNGAGCVGTYSYTAVLIHEMLHGLGLGHIGNGMACSALMNPVVCNSNSTNNVTNYGITNLDEECTEWMYVNSFGSCPTLNAQAPPINIINESFCNSSCDLVAGSFGAPSGNCPSGSTLQYSTNNGSSWTTNLPSYNANFSMSVLTRCNCDCDNNISSPTRNVTTNPGSCTTPSIPSGMSITNSACQSDGVTVSGGSFNGFGSACTTGVLTFYANSTGTTGATTTAPNYNQTGPAQTIYMRCVDTSTDCESGLVSLGPTNPGECSCPTLSSATPSVVISSESSCTAGCSVSGGSLSAPNGSCPSGSTLEYSTNNGSSWTPSLPSYNQTSSITILTRCNCDSDNSISSPTTSVSTNPGSCSTPSSPSGMSITNSACQSDGVTVSGGSFNGFGSACTTGVLTFYNNASGTTGATTTAPNYNQTGPAQTIYMRCVDTSTDCESGVVSLGPTNPDVCTCPVLSAAAPSVVISSESSCASDCTLSGGSLSAPNGTCPTASTLEYSTDTGLSWSTILPVYNQNQSMMILTRCNCDVDNSVSSANSSVVTMPGACNTPNDPIGMSITNSQCQSDGVTVSGGSFNGFGSACTTGVLTFYDNAAGTLGATLLAPSYNQTGPVQTIFMRCVDVNTNCESGVISLGPTSPEECFCPDLSNSAPEAVISSESNCTPGCNMTGGVILAPINDCPLASTLEYSLDGGVTWNNTLPVYDQNANMNILTRCICDINQNIISPISGVETNPNLCVEPSIPAGYSLTNSSCQADGVSVSGGSFSGFNTACSVGQLTFYNDIDGTMGATTLFPTYNQNGPSQIFYLRCVDPISDCQSAVVSLGPSSPGACFCPDLSAITPQVIIVSESECNSICSSSGGLLEGPAQTCPLASTMVYSQDNGASWTSILPSYDQSNSATILSRCSCDLDDTVFSPSGLITTNPTVCLDPVSPQGVTIRNSSCNESTGVISGGSFLGFNNACGVYDLTFFSDPNGILNPTINQPAYDQNGPSQVLYMRCVDPVTSCSSPVVTLGPTNPGQCFCPDLSTPAPPINILSESLCGTNCFVTSGALIPPTGNCPIGSSLEYSVNGGLVWTQTIPLYIQDSSMGILTRCICNFDSSQTSPNSSVTTTPGICNTPAVPSGIEIANSSCLPDGVTTGNGSFIGFDDACVDAVLTFYDDALGSIAGTTIAPNYNQNGPTQILYMRCVDPNTNCESPVVTIGPTSPEECSCPDLTGIAPAVQIVSESSCGTGCTLDGGLLQAPTTSCPGASILRYSVDAGNSWTTEVPEYNQNESLTIISQCICELDNTIISPANAVVTSPEYCVIPDSPFGISIENSACDDNNVEGSFIGFSTACSESVLYFYSDGTGINGGTTLAPSYNQEGPSQILFMRCVDRITNCESELITVGPTEPRSDFEAPIPVCLNFATAILVGNPEAVLLKAKNFDDASEDNCSATEDLVFSFSSTAIPKRNDSYYVNAGVALPPLDPNGSVADGDWYDGSYWYYNTSTGDLAFANGAAGPDINEDKYIPAELTTERLFTQSALDSADIDSIVSQEIFVWDQFGNNDHCEMQLRLLLENENFTNARISGKVTSFDGRPLAGVVMTANNNIAGYPIQETTDAIGQYAFPDNPSYKDYVITGVMDEDYLNGVSTLDIVLIQRHILGTRDFTNPEQIIAADVNSDQQVSSIDLLELRKLILGIYEKLPQNDSWRLMPVEENLVLTNPWPFLETRQILSIRSHHTDEDFKAIKIGDVNNSVQLLKEGSPESELRSSEDLIFQIQNLNLVKHHEVSIPITADNYNQVIGFQFSSRLENIKVVGIEGGVLNLDESNWNVEDNNLHLSYNQILPVDHNKDEILFSVKIVSQIDQNIKNAFKLYHQDLKPEAYKYSDVSKAGLQIVFSESKGQLKLSQNVPNPFISSTEIDYFIDQNQTVQFHVFDINGRMIYSDSIKAKQGKNSLSITKEMLQNSGVYYYQLSTENDTQSRKMIVL